MRPGLLLAGFGPLWAVQGHANSARVQQQAPVCSDDSQAGQASSEISSLRPRDGLNATAAAKAAIDSMNNGFYDASQGRWTPSVAWWLSGVALTTLLDYMFKTGSQEYMTQAKQVIQQQRNASLAWWPQGGGEFRVESTDDTGWWALAMVRMYDLTGDREYLNISIKDEAYMYSQWTDADCGGGVYVDVKTGTYKNAIANELYIKLAASLHNRIRDGTTYLSRAERAWSWFKASGMINQDNLINDGLAEDDNGVCFNNKLPTWTYNQGVILGGLAELHRATQNASYLTSARTIADAVLSSKNTLTQGDPGILTEPCEAADSCNDDQQVFKGVFAANLAELDDALPDADEVGSGYRPYLAQNAESAHARARDAAGFYDVGWAGPFRNSTLSKQASAAWLMVASI
ncbi:hypothetical protein VTK56DRAFT_5718 [Thermocarpiscus australiensis]